VEHEYSYIENPEEYSNPWQMEARKRQLTNLFRHGEQCLGAWQRQAVTLSKPKTVDKRQVRLSKYEVSRRWMEANVGFANPVATFEQHFQTALSF